MFNTVLNYSVYKDIYFWVFMFISKAYETY